MNIHYLTFLLTKNYNMKLKKLPLLFIFMIGLGLFAQENFPANDVIVGTYIGETLPLRDFPTIAENLNLDPKTLTIVPNESTTQIEINNVPATVIANVQKLLGNIVTMPIEQNFIGASASESGFFPPDPTGGVGPNHYVHSVNSLVKIFDKTGTLLVGPVSLGSFLGFGGNSGDPIVLYDQLADRWLVSEFGNINGGNSLAVGISTTNDPTGTYNLYQYSFPGFPDYPHYAVWPDGYYGTVNLGGQTTRAFVMERDVLLAGGPNPEIVIFSLPGVVVNPNQVKSPEAANLLGTTIAANTPGYITYLQDDAWNGVTFDHLKIWEINVDPVNFGNTTISTPLLIATDPFDAGEIFGQGAVSQPNTSQKLAAHGGIISFGSNYRSFADHNSWLITFNTFIDGNQTGGIRWIELRNDGVSPWTIYQEGTYAIADGHSRFMSSSAMDAAGNIGLAYSIGSATLPVGIRYTGRYDGDPLGQMTVAETTIVDGVGVRTNTYRYGDYGHMTMDPNNFTFWHTADFFSSNNNWRTQIASFSLSGGFANDVGINNIISPDNGILSNVETVEVSIRNFGLGTQTIIPLELRVNGNLVATEIFTGNINANETATYIFAQTVDLSTSGQTYVIEAKTALTGDQFSPNDPFTKNVTHLLTNDVGPLEVTAPETGSGLGNETITVTIKNFGAASQSNFDVQYTVNGGSPVIETFAGPIASEAEVSYNFAQTADFTALGSYTVTVSTDLVSDANSSNNEITTVIENVLCQPNIDCSFGDGFRLFSIAEINNPSGCEGYGDFTNQIANLAPGSTNDLTVTTGYGDQFISVWIDYNDDFTFTSNELVVNNYEIANGQGAGTYTETFDLVVPANATIGQHRMRAKANWNAPVPPDACTETTYGETEDYTANIGVLGVEDIAIKNSDLVIVTKENNQFELLLTSDYEGTVYVSIFNLLGQQLGSKMVTKDETNTYRLKIDMSYAASGVYIVKTGGHNTQTFKTGRILVK